MRKFAHGFKEGEWVEVASGGLVETGSIGRVSWIGEDANGGDTYAYVRLSHGRSLGIFIRDLRKLEPRAAAIEEAKWALR